MTVGVVTPTKLKSGTPTKLKSGQMNTAHKEPNFQQNEG